MAEEVELVSSGYAWRCPECSSIEYENAVPSSGKVCCTRCGASFPVSKVARRVEGGALDNAKAKVEGEL
jgi:DNA-directed RNA polymerase subunit RPC12/RpoP